MTPLGVMHYPTLCVQKEPATKLRGAGGRRAVAFLCKNFVPYGCSLGSLEGNKHHSDNTIPSACANLDFVWTFGADLGLNCVKNPDWCGLTWPRRPICPPCQPYPQPLTSSHYFTDIKETQHYGRYSQRARAASTYLQANSPLISSQGSFFFSLQKGLTENQARNWNYCCRLSVFISGFQAWRERGEKKTFWDLSRGVTVKNQKNQAQDWTWYSAFGDGAGRARSLLHRSVWLV